MSEARVPSQTEADRVVERLAERLCYWCRRGMPHIEGYNSHAVNLPESQQTWATCDASRLLKAAYELGMIL
jgi:hypothetical protein